MIIHVVEPEETLASIAESYGLTPDALQVYNQLPNPDNLVVGQTIIVMYIRRQYTVQPQDTLEQIAIKNGITTIQLLQRNPQLAQGRDIYEGETLVIEYEEEPLGELEVNGYAYPYIDEYVLRSSLPYLTYLTIFGYGFDLEGNLTTIPDEPLIELARQYQTASVMLISSVSPEGVFNSYLASALMKDPQLQDTLLNNILATMESKGYVGLDIDFEYIPPEDAQGYAAFIQRAKTKLHEQGYFVHVDLAPKTSADQRGLLYEAHDYDLIGAEADQVLIMTYEWGYLYGPPMAVAPLNQVRRVLEYAVSAIPPEKIQMGIPNYGYDWTLPFQRGRPARLLGNMEAVQLAADYQAQIEYDLVSASPFFYYTAEDGAAHVVWFEDARSIQAKLNLLFELKLAGAGYWNVMRLFLQNWMMLGQMFYIRKLL